MKCKYALILTCFVGDALSWIKPVCAYRFPIFCSDIYYPNLSSVAIGQSDAYWNLLVTCLFTHAVILLLRTAIAVPFSMKRTYCVLLTISNVHRNICEPL